MAAEGRLTRLLRPRSIAVVGGRPAARVIRQCDRLGFDGPIWAVHPEHRMVEGRPCVPRIDALPEAPDAVFIGVNRVATVEVVRALAAVGAGGAVCYAAGFRETDAEGAALQDALCAAAGAMPVLGPNCYGFVNALDRAALWPDLHGAVPVERGVALVTQSSNIAINLTMSRRGLPVAMVVALGNQAAIGLAETVAALAEDPRITAIGLHVEGIADPAGLAEAVAVAAARGIRAVVLKSGRSEAGAALALSHTASLSGGAAVASAYFARIGVAEVGSLTALLETLKVLHVGGPLRGRRIVSLQCSGGEAALMADAVAGRSLTLPPFTEEDRARIARTTHPLVTISNPFDYHTFDWGDRQRLAATFTAVMEAGQDATVLLLDWPRAELGDVGEWDASALALADAAAATGTRTALIATIPETMPPGMAETLAARGVVPLFGIADGLAALEAAALLGASDPRPIAPPTPVAAGRRIVLAEVAAKALLADWGLPIPDHALCRSEAEAVAAAARLGWPVVAKAAGADLLHKTERGAVRVGLADEAALREAWRALAPLGEAVLVERMAGAGMARVELLLGVARDPVMGLHLVLGAGGVLTELLQDSRILLLPVTRAEVTAALRSLRIAPLLDGFRGAPPADLDAAADAVMALARFALAHADRLLELDINPLIVLPKGRGAVVADALVTLVEGSDMKDPT